jgi:predicted PurR-regulated permease PerM
MKMMDENTPQEEVKSPPWGTTTKLVVGLTIVALMGVLVNQIRPLLTPLILALILSYLLYPFIELLTEKTRLSWRGSVNLVFLILLALFLGSLTASSVALINQADILVGVVDDFLNNLPNLINDLSTNGLPITVPIIGTQIDLAEYIAGLNIDLLGLSQQLLSAVQPLLGQAGGIITTVAASVGTGVTWMFFVLAISYLGLGEARNGRSFLKEIQTSSMGYDFARMGRELSRIYNTFLRGQVLIAIMVGISTFLLMLILGVHNALLLALIAGLAKFVPYAGPLVGGIVNALIAFFQEGGNYMGLQPFWYAVLIVLAAIALDQIFDSVITPRLFGSTLGVHPAGVLIMALVLYRWIGILGLLLAAPVLASGQLLVRYITLKMLDQDPWSEDEEKAVPFSRMVTNLLKSVWMKLRALFSKIKLPRKKPNDKGKENDE